MFHVDILNLERICQRFNAAAGYRAGSLLTAYHFRSHEYSDPVDEPLVEQAP
jgi:hypothetical protein